MLKIKAVFLLVMFVAFLATPAIITFSNRDADISTYFSLTEEENQVKLNQPVYVLKIEKNHFGIAAIQFLRKIRLDGFRYVNNYNEVHLDITSPPPRLA